MMTAAPMMTATQMMTATPRMCANGTSGKHCIIAKRSEATTYLRSKCIISHKVDVVFYILIIRIIKTSKAQIELLEKSIKVQSKNALNNETLIGAYIFDLSRYAPSVKNICGAPIKHCKLLLFRLLICDIPTEEVRPGLMCIPLFDCNIQKHI